MLRSPTKQADRLICILMLIRKQEVLFDRDESGCRRLAGKVCDHYCVRNSCRSTRAVREINVGPFLVSSRAKPASDSRVLTGHSV